jgi:alkylation response protein AidB-like acyl-CoA dehydrogenase
MASRIVPLAGADRYLGRQSACGRVFFVGTTRDSRTQCRWLATVRLVPILQRQQSCAGAIIGAFLDKPGDPAAIAYLLVPFSEIEIIDDWHVLGLAGTGSRTLKLRDVFVPQHRCVMLVDLLAGTVPGAEVHADYPLVRTPRGLMVNYSLPPVAIALGNRALQVALATLRGKVSRGVNALAASEFVQMTVAEAAAAIDAATLTMHSGRARAEALIAKQEPIPQAYVLRTRRDMTYAQHQVQRAVEKLVEVCGAHRQPAGGDGRLGAFGTRRLIRRSAYPAADG